MKTNTVLILAIIVVIISIVYVCYKNRISLFKEGYKYAAYGGGSISCAVETEKLREKYLQKTNKLLDWWVNFTSREGINKNGTVTEEPYTLALLHLKKVASTYTQPEHTHAFYKNLLIPASQAITYIDARHPPFTVLYSKGHENDAKMFHSLHNSITGLQQIPDSCY